MNRSVIACLLALVLFGGVSNGQWGEGPEVVVEPRFPTASDVLTFYVSGMWHDACVPKSMDIFVEGQAIYLDVIHDYPSGTMCAQVISNYTVSESIGPLPAGEYVVYKRIRDVTEYSQVMVIGVGPGRWYWPPSEVVISPENPTSLDEVSVVLEGEWLDTCVPTGVEVRREERNIYLDVLLDYEPHTGCGDAITPWKQEAVVGKLSPGAYTIFARIAENVMVPETEYVKLKEIKVESVSGGGLYLFLPEESSVTQTGGFAGITEKYEVEGMFALKIDFEEGVAAFGEVDATLSQRGFLPTASLGDLFNMENLTSTSVSADAIRFTGFTSDDVEVVIEVLFSESNVHLIGRIRPGCCDRFNYDLDGYAVPIKEPICRELPEMDFTGDCQVDLADLAVFAQSWMECNLFPRSACR